MRLVHVLTVLLALSALGCTASSPTSGTPSPPADATPPTQTAPVAVAPTPAPAPVVSEPTAPPQAKDAPGDRPAAFDPSNPDRRCRTDADCAVKNVGSCCGYFPLCVNKDAKTDPAAVRAQCERDGISSICGFQEVKGCQCVQGRCENLADGASAVM
ncbi:MAG: hypothetical protein ACOY82_08335 [Pseudomonadota bacterium]